MTSLNFRKINIEAYKPGRSILKKLHIYADSHHPHESQNPKELSFHIKKVEENG